MCGHTQRAVTKGLLYSMIAAGVAIVKEERVVLGSKRDPEVRGQQEQTIEGTPPPPHTHTRTGIAESPRYGSGIHPAHGQRMESRLPLQS